MKSSGYPDTTQGELTMPTELTQPKDTNRHAEAPSTVNHAVRPPSGNVEAAGRLLVSDSLSSSLPPAT
jgi:hypothetical protein